MNEHRARRHSCSKRQHPEYIECYILRASASRLVGTALRGDLMLNRITRQRRVGAVTAVAALVAAVTVTGVSGASGARL